MVRFRLHRFIGVVTGLILATSAFAQVRIDTRTLFVPVQVEKQDASAQTTANLRTTALSHATARALFEPSHSASNWQTSRFRVPMA